MRCPSVAPTRRRPVLEIAPLLLGRAHEDSAGDVLGRVGNRVGQWALDGLAARHAPPPNFGTGLLPLRDLPGFDRVGIAISSGEVRVSLHASETRKVILIF